MNYFLGFLFLFSSFFSFSQDKPKKIIKKHSAGILAMPLTLSYWDYPYSFSSDGSSRLQFNVFSSAGLRYNYQIHHLLSIECNLLYGKESLIHRGVRTDNINYFLDYKVHYLKIPLGLRFYPFHNKYINSPGGFYLQVAGNFDFILRRDIEEQSSVYSDPHLPKPPNWTGLEVHEKGIHSSAISFNRICPTISIGQEVAGEHLTFFYSGLIEIPPVYQEKSNFDLMEIWKVNILTVGLSYRF